MRFGGREAVRELSGAALARLKPDSQWLVDPHLARCPLPIPGTVGSPYLARSRHRHIVARGWDGLMIRWSNLPMGGGESSVVCRLGILWGESSLSRQPSLAACLIERVFAVEGRSCSFPGTLVPSTNAPVCSDATRIETSRLRRRATYHHSTNSLRDFRRRPTWLLPKFLTAAAVPATSTLTRPSTWTARLSESASPAATGTALSALVVEVRTSNTPLFQTSHRKVCACVGSPVASIPGYLDQAQVVWCSWPGLIINTLQGPPAARQVIGSDKHPAGTGQAGRAVALH